MKRLVMWTIICGAALGGSVLITSAQTTNAIQKSAFGTISRGTTVCVGPIAPVNGGQVQLFGFTNGNANLTWQILTVSSQTAPTVIFQTSARSVNQLQAAQGNLLFEACVVKDAGSSEDFTIDLNAPPSA